MTEDPNAAPDAARSKKARQAEELVITTITRYADSALRIARRHSLCVDDAHDAYQRAVEILMRHAHRLDPERAGSWLHTVVKHEAMAVRRSRQRLVGADEVDLDALEARTTPSPEERVLQFEHLSRSAEALQRLKPNEVRALWLKAAGNSYAEICDATGWTYTKVNRCLAEGRRSFLERYAGIEAGEECLRWQPGPVRDGGRRGDERAADGAAPAPAQLHCLPSDGARAPEHRHLPGRAVPRRGPHLGGRPRGAGGHLPHTPLRDGRNDDPRAVDLRLRTRPGGHRSGDSPQDRGARRVRSGGRRRRDRSREGGAGAQADWRSCVPSADFASSAPRETLPQNGNCERHEHDYSSSSPVTCEEIASRCRRFSERRTQRGDAFQ
jgi:RNA polymerase sigma factor (sigma-70 family)